jgi:hypothetical protein
VQHEFGDRVRLKMVYVGSKPAWVGSFPRRERLAAEITTLPGWRSRLQLVTLSVPGLYVVSGSEVKNIDFTGRADATERLLKEALRAALSRTPSKDTPWSGAGTPTNPTGSRS